MIIIRGGVYKRDKYRSRIASTISITLTISITCLIFIHYSAIGIVVRVD